MRSAWELGQQACEVAARKGPLKWRRCLLVVDLESEETLLQRRQTGDVVRRQDLALHHGEVDFDRVEPPGMDRRVDLHEVPPAGP